MHRIGAWFQAPFSSFAAGIASKMRRTWHRGHVKTETRYGTAYSTWPTPTRSGGHARSWCGGHYQHSGRDAAKAGVSQQTQGLAPLYPESWCGDHNQWSVTGLPRTVPPHKDTSIPDMPVCHCVGLHQKWAASADATTVTPRKGSGQPLALG